MALVPEDFDVPTSLETGHFRLEPLDVEHNVADHQAWQTSIEHIRATPGFSGGTWPDPAMSLEDNRDDLARHAEEFAQRDAFAYSVLAPSTDMVIGCVYIDPSDEEGVDADVRSWVRVTHAHLDQILFKRVRDWLADEWPFETVRFPGREDT